MFCWWTNKFLKRKCSLVASNKHTCSIAIGLQKHLSILVITCGNNTGNEKDTKSKILSCLYLHTFFKTENATPPIRYKQCLLTKPTDQTLRTKVSKFASHTTLSNNPKHLSSQLWRSFNNFQSKSFGYSSSGFTYGNQLLVTKWNE